MFSNSSSSRPKLAGASGRRSALKGGENPSSACGRLELFGVLLSRGVVLGALVCGVLVSGCRRVFAVESIVNADYGVMGRSMVFLRGAWPKVLQLLRVFKDQGLILAALLGLSAFFSMAETSITTLWPWKVQLYVQVAYDRLYCFNRQHLNLVIQTIAELEYNLAHS